MSDMHLQIFIQNKLTKCVVLGFSSLVYTRRIVSQVTHHNEILTLVKLAVPVAQIIQCGRDDPVKCVDSYHLTC